MAILIGLIALTAVILIIVAAIYIHHILRKIEIARQEMAELKKNLEELKGLSSVLKHKVEDLTKNMSKIYLASLEEWR